MHLYAPPSTKVGKLQNQNNAGVATEKTRELGHSRTRVVGVRGQIMGTPLGCRSKPCVRERWGVAEANLTYGPPSPRHNTYTQSGRYVQTLPPV